MWLIYSSGFNKNAMSWKILLRYGVILFLGIVLYKLFS
ncbi:putative membrane protein [Rickettsia amblyommatis str. Darkwater]|nr:putative membrane protein [Rickettsia amblyommatis str. Darkwater]